MHHVLLAQAEPGFWTEAVKQAPALAVFAVLMLGVFALVLRIIQLMSRDGKAVVATFMKSQERMAEVIDRNTKGFAVVDVMVHELRELRREEDERHRENIHAMRGLANAAGLKKQWEEIQQAQAHKTRGGPPGTIVVETPPVTLGLSEEGGP